GLHSNESVKTSGGEVGKIARNLLEACGAGSLLEGFHRREVELRLAISGRCRTVQVGLEFGELGLVETDLTSIGIEQREVGTGVVFLECSRILGILVEYRKDRSR